jgi:hypothetical protein
MGMMPGMMLSPDGQPKTLYRYVARFSQLYYVFMIILFAISLPIVLRLPIGPPHIGLAIIISLILVYLVFFGEPRYHFAMMPWVAIYSGLGAQALLLGRSSLRIAQSSEVPAYSR